MKVLKMSDTISISEAGINVKISPLNHLQKMEISDCMKLKAGEDSIDFQKTARLTLKFSVREITGLTNYDDTPYTLEFDGDYLSENCITELMTALATTQLFTAINFSLANKFDVELEGVDIEVQPKK